MLPSSQARLPRPAAAFPLIVCALVAFPALASPRLELRLPEHAPRAESPFRIALAVTWDGGPGAFVILPPEIPESAGLTLRHGPSETRARADGAEVLHWIEAQANEAGTFTIPAFRVAFAAPEDLEASVRGVADAPAPAHAYRELVSESAELRVRPPLGPLLRYGGIAGGLCALVLLAAALIARTRRRRAANPMRSPADSVREALHLARQRRLDGDYYAFYRELSRGMELVAHDQETRSLLIRLRTRTQEVGYKGVTPADSELDGDLRDVERAFARRKEELAA